MAGQLPAGHRLSRLRLAGFAVLALGAALSLTLLALARRGGDAPARHVIRPELSVHGVVTGSLVRLNGVVIGHVTKVGFWSDPASGQVRPEIAFVLGEGRSDLHLRAKVADGLRARCIPLNPASGFLEIDLVWSPGSPLRTATGDADEIPWEPSPQQLAYEEAFQVVSRLAAADLRDQADRLIARLAEAEGRVGDGPAVAAALAARAAGLRETVERLARVVGPEPVGLAQGRLGELREALRALDASLDALDQDLGAGSGAAIESLREFSRACRDSAARLRRDVPGDDPR